MGSHDHYGDLCIDRARRQGLGIDSVRVRCERREYVLTDLAGRPRAVKVVFDDGSTDAVRLDGTVRVRGETRPLTFMDVLQCPRIAELVLPRLTSGGSGVKAGGHWIRLAPPPGLQFEFRDPEWEPWVLLTSNPSML